MASVFPFRAYRYSEKAGPLENLVTQPYDKISTAMRARYLSLSPYNLVRIILGEPRPTDTGSDNVYTRAAGHLGDWIARGVLAQDAEPAFYAYFQEFQNPDSGERLLRKGFIGLGEVVDYSAGIVHRHEQTLTGPKKDRMALLDSTQAHFGQIFMLYDDEKGSVDALLDTISADQPPVEVQDEYGGIHRLWPICEAGRIAEITRLMQPRKLLIADGHHRYETALAFRRDNPALPGAERVMMTFVNMYSPGLKILATHRLVSGLDQIDLTGLGRYFRVVCAGSAEALKSAVGRGRIGVALGDRWLIAEAEAPNGRLDVEILHSDLLGKVLGIDEQAVREEKYIRYIRGTDAALEQVRSGAAQLALLLHPTAVEDVSRVSFSGGVMPQKSTDFYPKLLSGLAIYRAGY